MPAVGPQQAPVAAAAQMTPEEVAQIQATESARQGINEVTSSQLRSTGPGQGVAVTTPDYQSTRGTAKDVEIRKKEEAAIQRDKDKAQKQKEADEAAANTPSYINVGGFKVPNAAMVKQMQDQQAEMNQAPARIEPKDITAGSIRSSYMPAQPVIGAIPNVPITPTTSTWVPDQIDPVQIPQGLQNMINMQAGNVQTKAYGGALYKFVGGGDAPFIDPTSFNQDVYNQMAAKAGPAPEGMENPYLVTQTADYDYGTDRSGAFLSGMQALTDIKKKRDYNREAAQLPNQLSASNLFKEYDNEDKGDYAVNSGMLGIGNTTTGMRMSKYGGDENSEGNIYFLDEDTIRRIMAMGGTVEYLD